MSEYKPMKPFYPRMTPNARKVMEAVQTNKVSRSTFDNDTIRKNVARKLLWDGWIKIVDPGPQIEKESGELRLTADGRAWLERDKTMHNERIRSESQRPLIKIRYS